MINIEFILISVISIIAISLLLYIMTNTATINIPQQIDTYKRTKLDYESDITFLNSIIFDIVNQEKFAIDLQQIDYMNNKELKIFTIKIALKVQESLSDQYIEHMYFYFSEKGFSDYINQVVFRSTLAIAHDILQKNNIPKTV